MAWAEMYSKAEIRAIISTCVDENTIDSAPVSSRGNVVSLSPDETGSTAIEVLRAERTIGPDLDSRV